MTVCALDWLELISEMLTNRLLWIVDYVDVDGKWRGKRKGVEVKCERRPA